MMELAGVTPHVFSPPFAERDLNGGASGPSYAMLCLMNWRKGRGNYRHVLHGVIKGKPLAKCVID